MSTGAKAGIAIGIIAVIGLVAALLLWFLGKKRREQEEDARANDEKTTFGASQNAVPMTRTPTVTSPTAPRLSLRPMSRMMDGFMGSSNRRSGGNLLNTISEGGAAAGVARGMSPSPQPRSVPPQRQEKPQHENPFADPQNPFADPASAPVRGPPPAAIRPPPVSAAIAPSQPSPQPRTKFNPNTAPPSQSKAMNLDAPSPAPTLPSSSPIAPLAFGATAGVAAGGLAAAAASKPSPAARSPSPEQDLPIQHPPSPERPRREAPSPTPDTAPMPPTVAAAMPSPGSSAAADAAGGNVYRVLMDFAPSMDDELELKTGQLVRMLHEYDDGWVSQVQILTRKILTMLRLFVSNSTARSKVSPHEHVSLPNLQSPSHLISLSMLVAQVVDPCLRPVCNDPKVQVWVVQCHQPVCDLKPQVWVARCLQLVCHDLKAQVWVARCLRAWAVPCHLPKVAPCPQEKGTGPVLGMGLLAVVQDVP